MRSIKRHHRGASLLEVTIATAIMGLIVSAATVSIRTSQGVWNEYGGDSTKLDAAHATALHLIRQLRQCVSVSAISDPAVSAGNITSIDSDGDSYVWSLTGDEVRFGIGSATDLLAGGISGMAFTGYEVDGTTTTTVAADIHSVAFIVSVDLDRNVNATKTIHSRVWLRSW